MRILIIDNYDSFTYNLVQLVGEVGGPPPRVVMNDEMSWADLQRAEFDAIILSPGPGRADRHSDFGLCRDAIVDGRWPILGVCLGHQGIAHQFGAQLDHAPEPFHGRLSAIRHSGTDLFEGIPSPFEAVRYHSFIVRDLPPDLIVTATTDDGLIMALRHASRPLWGVQFHPESVATEHGARLISNFLALAARRRRPPLGPCSRNAPVPTTDLPAPDRSPLTLFTRRIAAPVCPETAFLELYGDAANAFWLDSSAVIADRSRYSFMGDDSGPNAERLCYSVGGRLDRFTAGGRETLDEPLFEFLDRRLRQHRHIVGAGLQLPFLGGYVGYLGFELKADTTGELVHPSPNPDAQLIFADRVIAYDHVEGETWLLCLERPEFAERAAEWLDRTKQRLLQARPRPAPTFVDRAPDDFSLVHDRSTYLRLIGEALREIRNGESYEVCLTTQTIAEVDVDPTDAYRALRMVNPAPYAALLRFADLHVLCCSPERFVRIDREGAVDSKPIKGTIRRDKDPAEDARLKRALGASEKDQAENLMIVDLIRNDLGKVCSVGSVRVPKFCAVETYASVHQMVSTITGKLAAGRSAIDCVRALFPGGSMTGAPKIRTMQIIDRLEAAPRGVYSGAIGYFSVDGGVDLNITIRTVVLQNGSAAIGAGGALIALSDPKGEFDEMLLKSALIRETLNRMPNRRNLNSE
jgi:para-aminobenzoate synthetase